MKFKSLLLTGLIFSSAAQATTNCWALLLKGPRANAATKEFVRLVKMSEELFGVSIFSHKTSEALPLNSSDKAILLKWIEEVENFGPTAQYPFKTLEAAISKLPKTQGIFFSKSPSYFSQVILDKDLKEGDIIVVPPQSGFSASKMTPESPIPAFTKDGFGMDKTTFFKEGPYLFVFGEARDFSSLYSSHNENHENEVNFGSGTKFKVLKVIYHSDQSAGTFFLKQL